MSSANLLNLIGVIVSLFSFGVIIYGLMAHVNIKKTDFKRSLKYFSDHITIENFYFNNGKFLTRWIINLEYIYIPLLAVVPGSFAIISAVSFDTSAMLWLIGYLLEYALAIIFIILFYKKHILTYAETINQTNYNYAELKKIKIDILENYSFSVIYNNIPIMRNRAFQHNFKVLKKRYQATNDSFKQYRILMLFLNRFAAIIDTLAVADNCQKYVIITSTGKQINYTNECFAEQVLLTIQSIIH